MPGTIAFGIDVETASENSVGYARYASELFHELNTPVTWFLTGRTLECYPDVFRPFEKDELIELQAHTYDHLLLKTVLMEVPPGKTRHGAQNWFLKRGGSLEEVEADLTRCQQVFRNALGRPAVGLTGPWGYYRGLGDRPDILEIVDRHGFKFLRTFARNEWGGLPVPLEWQPRFYQVQGFPHILETMVHDYQDDFVWEDFVEPTKDMRYADHLKEVADKVAEKDLIFSMASHDHGCATREGFEKKGVWVREIIEYAHHLGIRFITYSELYKEMCEARAK